MADIADSLAGKSWTGFIRVPIINELPITLYDMNLNSVSIEVHYLEVIELFPQLINNPDIRGYPY